MPDHGHTLDDILAFVFRRLPKDKKTSYQQVTLGGVTFSRDKFGSYYDTPTSDWNTTAIAHDATVLIRQMSAAEHGRAQED